ncbi:MAG: Peptidase, M23B family [Parcubacteria group bacterium GW2011_GWA1_47_8]|nr:MAG: Peptidase, M23B family [Parcubacteria group bacterium GW2011_GWA1_47_8]KKW07716.1 MAG: Peptidase, M23B family [Parcubacteria group bacterium GW2011_GWA2_49_16]
MMRTYFFQFLTLLLSGMLVAGAQYLAPLAHAETAVELKAKISSKTDEIKKIEAEIKKYQEDLDVIGAQKQTLKTSIAELNLTRKKLEADIRATQAKVESTNFTIAKLGSNIVDKEGKIDSRKRALIEALRVVYENDTRSLLEVALSEDSFSDFWNDAELLNQFGDEIYSNVVELKSIKAGLEQEEKRRQEEKRTLLGLKTELGDRNKIVVDNKNQKSRLLTQTNSQETTYKKILKEKIALKEAFEQELRDYESTLKFILDPSLIPPRGAKVFLPPLDKVLLTQKFGKSDATNGSGQRLYASGTHNGIDFRASLGTQVKAMKGGIVLGSGDTDLACPGASFGKWVLVDHENGLASIYAHLSLIKATAGDKVVTGQVIGYSGNTGYSTGPHLHVSVYASSGVKIETRPSKSCQGRSYTMPLAAINAYLDPLDYLVL